MKIPPIVIASAFLSTAALLHAEAVKDREGAVRADRAKMENDARWIYNDVDRGFAEAKKTGKPLLVVLRCVPCKACMGIDASILESTDLQPLLDQFVCVRVINANSLDLSLFQFDYDLSFSTMFFNADRTVYGRYGSWQHQRDANDATTAGYKAALNATLAVHHAFPANKNALGSKQGGSSPFKTPVEIPFLASKYERELNWNGNVVQSCVHCHQIGDAFRTSFRGQGQPIPVELIYPMPAPETIGLTLDAQFTAKVSAVEAGSAAERAGFRAGDDLVAVNDAPLISIADFAWSLHRASDPDELHVRVRHEGEERLATLKLDHGWRMRTDISTRVGTWPMRAMATGGLKLESLPPAEREARGVPAESMALVITRLGEQGLFGAAKKAGFKKDDILLAVDGIAPGPITESQFLGRLLIDHPQKTSLKTTVLRGKEHVDLMLPMQ